MTITLTREEAQQVLDAFELLQTDIEWQFKSPTRAMLRKIEKTFRARLAQPEPEPVAWADKHDIDREGHDFHVSRQQPAKDGAPLYTAPPQREWKGLEADGESQEIWLKVMEETKDKRHLPVLEFAVAIEAKLKEKNGG
jgi:hypothetical protein